MSEHRHVRSFYWSDMKCPYTKQVNAIDCLLDTLEAVDLLGGDEWFSGGSSVTGCYYATFTSTGVLDFHVKDLYVS